MSDNDFRYDDAAAEYSPIKLDTDRGDQYLETVRPSSEQLPEKGLMIAVLQDAVISFQKHLFASTRRTKSEFQEAENWIFSEDEKSLFSYRNICETLGIDFARLRAGLTQWKRRHIEEHSRRRSAQFN